MATWKIKPLWKKSIVDRAYWSKDGKTIVNSVGWRWGEFTVETSGDEPPRIDEDTDIHCNDQFEVIDYSTEDGCWEDNEFEGEWTEEEQAEMEERLNGEISVYELEEEDWSCDHSETFVSGDVEIVRVNEDGTETKVEVEAQEWKPTGIKLEPKAPWPF